MFQGTPFLVGRKLAKLTTGSDPFAPPKEEKGGRYEGHGYEAEEATAPVDTNALVQWVNEERKGISRERSHKGIGGDGARAVACECVD